MKLTLRVDFTDGAQATVVTNLWVITQWERKYKSKITQMATGIGAEDLAFLAYEACKVSNVVVDAAFDSFIKKVDKVEVLDSETENPTHEAPSADD
jgi:hypothetical protein